MKNWEQIPDESRKGMDNLLKKLSDGGVEEEEYLYRSIRERAKYNPRQMLERWKKERMLRSLGRWSVVAGFVLLFSSSVCLWLLHREQAPTTIAQKIVPGHTMAILTLANGVVQHLSDTVFPLISGNDAPIINKKEEGVEWHTLTVVRGGEFSMTLPDGSRVWLNSESELKFPPYFSSAERKVFLKGEGYFDVVKREVPFLVELREGTIQVFGTQFNVSNYETGMLAATLVEGNIGFTALTGKTSRLKPSQHLQYSEIDDEITVVEVNSLIYTAWKNNLFCFEEQSLEEIMKMLGRWYNVEADFETEDLKNLKLSGTLERYADITQFFRLFEFSSDIQFEIIGRRVIIKRK